MEAGGSKRNFQAGGSSAPQEKRPKIEEDHRPKEDAYRHPGSPIKEDRVKQAMALSRVTMQRLKLREYGHTDKLVNAIVHPKVYPGAFTVSCVLHDKLEHDNWIVADHHTTGNILVSFESSNIAKRLHGKFFRWAGEAVSFWNVASISPLDPDLIEEHPVERM